MKWVCMCVNDMHVTDTNWTRPIQGQRTKKTYKLSSEKYTSEDAAWNTSAQTLSTDAFAAPHKHLFQQYLLHWSFIEWQKHNNQHTNTLRLPTIFTEQFFTSHFSLQSFPGYDDTVNT